MLFLILLFVSYVSTLSTEFDETMFEFCCADEVCAANFQIAGCSERGYARQRFSYMLSDMMQTLQISESSALAGEELLHAVARNHQFCGVNQEVDPGGVCQCQHGKLCVFKTASEFKLSPGIQIALAVLTLLFVFFFSSKILHRLQKLNHEPVSSISNLADLFPPKWDER